MPAEIKIRDTQVGKEVAWHKLTIVEPKITKSNCRIIYPMEKQPLVLPDGTPTQHFSVVSLDDKLPIGNPVKKNYRLITNEQMMDMIEGSLEGTAHEIVSVGSLSDREKVFCSIKLDKEGSFVAAGRQTESVLNVLWGHGGVFGVTARAGFTVVVCANTFAMALREKKGDFQISVKHTGNASIKIENMGKAIENHYGVVAEFKKAMAEFESASVKKDEAQALFAGFLVRNDIEDKDEFSTRSQNTMETLQTLFNSGNGNKGENRADWFNAVTDYMTHSSSGGENVWKQFESSEFGSAFRRKTEAFNLMRGVKVPDLGDYNEVLKRGNKVLQLV